MLEFNYSNNGYDYKIKYCETYISFYVINDKKIYYSKIVEINEKKLIDKYNFMKNSFNYKDGHTYNLFENNNEMYIMFFNDRINGFKVKFE